MVIRGGLVGSASAWFAVDIIRDLTQVGVASARDMSKATLNSGSSFISDSDDANHRNNQCDI